MHIVIRILKIVLMAPFCFLIPGWLILSAFHRPEPGKHKFYLFELVAIAIALSSAITVLVAIVLGLIGLFNTAALAVCMVTVSLVVYLLGRKSIISMRRLSRKAGVWEIALLVIVLLIGAFYFLRPFAFDAYHFREGGDNINMGVALESEGSFFFEDRFLQEIPQEYRAAFYESSGSGFVMFPTYRFNVDQAGSVRFQYFYGYPALIAPVINIFGLTAAFYVSSAMMLLAVFLLFSLGRLLLKESAAKIATVIFAFSFLAIYFSWYHGAETPFLTFVLLLLIAFAYLVKTSLADKAFGTIVALAPALLLLLGTEAVFVFAGLTIFLLLMPADGFFRRNAPFLLAGAALLIGSALLYYWLLPRYIFGLFSENFGITTQRFWIYVSVGALALGVVAAVLNTFGRRLKAWLWRNLNTLFLIPMSALFIYGLVRIGTDTTIERFGNIFTLSDYVGAFVTLLMFMGLIVYCLREKEPVKRLFICAAFPMILIFINELHNYPLQPWAMRRYISFVFPALVLLAGYLIVEATNPLEQKRGLRAAFMGVTALAALVTLFFSEAPLIRYAKSADTPSTVAGRLQRIASDFSSSDVLIFNDNWEYSPAYPLKFAWGLNTILIPKAISKGEGNTRIKVSDMEAILEEPDKMALYFQMVDIWIGQGRRVLLFNPSVQMLQSIDGSLLLKAIPVADIGHYQADVIYSYAYDKIPETTGTINRDYAVYELVPG